MRRFAKVFGVLAALVFATMMAAGSADAGWSIVGFADSYAAGAPGVEASIGSAAGIAEQVGFKGEGEQASIYGALDLLDGQRYEG